MDIECPRCDEGMKFDEFVKHTRNTIPYNCINCCYKKSLKEYDYDELTVRYLFYKWFIKTRRIKIIS